jgi:CubicO group peptidase (beta-lactamase class C family)
VVNAVTWQLAMMSPVPPDCRAALVWKPAHQLESIHYNNYHPLLEGLLIRHATGMHVAEYLQEKF